MKKQNQGITLVALIITIIVLLILAGVTISSISGNDGMLTKIEQAKSISEQAQKEEQEILKDYENKIGKYISGTRDNKISPYINIYVDEKLQSNMPNKDSEYIFTYYTATDENTTLEFDQVNWSINLYNIKNLDSSFNMYFYTKDKINVVEKLLNIKYSEDTLQEFYINNLNSIFSNKFVYNYIYNSEGTLKEELLNVIESGKFNSKTVQAYADGNNTHKITLNPGRCIIKLSGNTSYNVTSFLVDGVVVKEIADNIYLCDVKSAITINWYCNHSGIQKFLYINYKYI